MVPSQAVNLRPRRRKLLYYQPSVENFGHSSPARDLHKIPERPRGEVLAAMQVIRNSDRFDWPLVYPSRGMVRCVGVPLQDNAAYIYFAVLDHRRILLVLHVSITDGGGPPEEGYRVARSRFDDVPL